MINPQPRYTENMASESPHEQRTIPSNEEVVEDVAKELEDIKIDKPLEEVLKVPPSDEVAASSSNPSIDPEAGSHIPEDFEKEIEEDDDETETGDWDDNVDEIALKDAEMTYSDEDRMRLKLQAEEMKKDGNQQFKDSNFRDSAITYTLALRTCPFSYSVDRAVLYSNRAASKMKLGLSKSAIEDCSKALELNPQYVRALWRRAQLYEETEKFDEALEDSKKVVEIDPSHSEANYAVRRLPDIINERNEKLKTEMLSKLKDLGNLFLRPFGLSTDNFQLNQDPNSGGYSVNFKQS